jgi:hypothetical protein
MLFQIPGEMRLFLIHRMGIQLKEAWNASAVIKLDRWIEMIHRQGKMEGGSLTVCGFSRNRLNAPKHLPISIVHFPFASSAKWKMAIGNW